MVKHILLIITTINPLALELAPFHNLLNASSIRIIELEVIQVIILVFYFI